MSRVMIWSAAAVLMVEVTDAVLGVAVMHVMSGYVAALFQPVTDALSALN